jgi:uncharacterized membrane protein HdeD (DUF308 family)
MTTLIETISSTLKHWYLPLIVGILFIAFEAYIFTIPLTAYATLSFMFSFAFYISGFGDIFFATSNKDSLDGWGWYLVSGILTTLLGVYLMIYPGVIMTILPFVVGFAMLFRSIQGLGFAIGLKKYGTSWGTLAFISVLGILVSFYLLVTPIAGAGLIVTLTALSIIVVGLYGIMLSLQLKKLKDLPAKIL